MFPKHVTFLKRKYLISFVLLPEMLDSNLENRANHLRKRIEINWTHRRQARIISFQPPFWLGARKIMCGYNKTKLLKRYTVSCVSGRGGNEKGMWRKKTEN